MYKRKVSNVHEQVLLVTGLSSNEFREMYDGAWPVLLADCARDRPALSSWRRDRLLERLGDHEWLAVESLIEGEYSIIETEHMSVRELVRGAREANRAATGSRAIPPT